MAEVTRYYLANNIIVYPTNNSINDEGKLNIEKNMSSIVTRITERNYCLKEEDFTLSVEPDTDYGFVIQIAEGQANIQGYHVMTNNYLRVRPPQEIKGKKIALGFKLSRDGSQNLLGDVTYNTVTEYTGLWVSYFDAQLAREDPDVLILGYLDWDGKNFSNVYDNPEKLGRIDASTIICELSDPKHPEVEFMYLQDWIDIVPDWYISKEGDVTYGEIDFLPGRLADDDKNALEDPSVGNKLPGIHIQAETGNKSVIHMMSSEKQTNGHELYYMIDDQASKKNATILFKYQNQDRGKLFISDPNNWLELYSNSVLHLDSKDQTLINSDKKITQKVNGSNNLTAELTAKNFSLSNPLNPKKIDFTINSTDLKFLLGDALFDYNNGMDFLTISGLDRVVFNDRVQIKNHLRVDQNLYLGPDGTNTILNQDKWVLSTTNLTQTFDNSGQFLKQKGGNEPRTRWENTDGSQWTEITPGNIKIKGPQAGITLVNPNGTQRNIYITNDGKVYIDGTTYVNGDIELPAGKKVWKACYN